MPTAFVTGGSGYLGRNLIKTLHAAKWNVIAPARSQQSAQICLNAGANSAPVDKFDQVDSIVQLLTQQPVDVIFHSAAHVEILGPLEPAWQINVEMTSRLLAAAKVAKVPKFVHISTEAVLVDGNPLINVDETHPYPARPFGIYPITKQEAEKRVVAANQDDFTTVVVRPRFIWGRDDTTLAPRIVQAARGGQMKFFNGGNYKISTCHVDNVVEGCIRAYEAGQGGQIYFLTDGEPVVFRDFISKLIVAYGGPDPSTIGSIPLNVMWGLSWMLEQASWLTGYRWLPPICRQALSLVGQEVTVSDKKAREQIGYKNAISIEDGLKLAQDQQTSSSSSA